MHYDLHGELRNTVGQETRLTQLSYRRWNVSLTDFDALLEKGVLEPSTWELLAGVLRASLPSDVLLRQPHLLRKQKTGMEHLPRSAKNPRMQIFPYRSNSKQWAMFVVTWVEEEQYSLRAIVPKEFAEEAFSWAISHLKHQFQIKDEPAYTHWPSETGAQLQIAVGLMQALSSELTKPSAEACSNFVTDALATLRNVRAAAVQAWSGKIEEVLSENTALQSQFENIFCIYPARRYVEVNGSVVVYCGL